MDPSDFSIIKKTIEGVEGAPVEVFPYPQRYGGTLPNEAAASHEKEGDNGMMAFGFDTNQAQAEQFVT